MKRRSKTHETKKPKCVWLNINVIYCSMQTAFFSSFIRWRNQDTNTNTNYGMWFALHNAYNTTHSTRLMRVCIFILSAISFVRHIHFLMITIIPIILEFLHCIHKKNVPLRIHEKHAPLLPHIHSVHQIHVTFHFNPAKLNLNREYLLIIVS